MNYYNLLARTWLEAQEILQDAGIRYQVEFFEPEKSKFPIDLNKGRIVRIRNDEAAGLRVLVMFEQQVSS